MATHVINKVNSRLRFLYRQNKFLDIPLRRLLCNAMIQPFFDYACNAWYPNLNKNLKTRLQAAQNKCIRFCLKLGDKTSIKVKEFEKINWLPVQDRVNQCIKIPRRKTNQGLRALSYIGPSLWNNLDKSLKTSVSLNAFKHNIKDHYFRKSDR